MSIFLFLAALPDSRIRRIDFPEAITFLIVVIDNPTCLQMGIDCYRSDVFETALLQILADLLRKSIADRDPSGIMPLIQYGLPSGVSQI